MIKKLTKEARVSAEELRISKLTDEHSAHFKVIFSHQIETKYNFASLNHNGSQATSNANAVKMFKEFGKFIDDSIRLTITDVENKYGRPADNSDGTYDPETKSKVQVEHFCLYEEGAKPKGASDSVRLHGYTRTNGGYFVVTRLDWFHSVHKK